MESSAPKHETIRLVLEKHVTLAARESVDHLWTHVTRVSFRTGEARKWGNDGNSLETERVPTFSSLVELTQSLSVLLATT